MLEGETPAALDDLAACARRTEEPTIHRVTDLARARFVEELGGLELIEAVHARPHFPRHAHATYALGVVDGGLNRFRYRGAVHTAQAGTLCTVTPEEAHTVEPAGGAGFAYRCLYPPLELLQELAEATGGRREHRTLLLEPVIDDVETVRLAARLFEALSAGSPPLAASALLSALLGRVIERHAAPRIGVVRPTPPGRAVARARDLLAARLPENVSLEELAAATGLGRFVLLRAFAHRYGIPPHAWVIQERVRRAKTLLCAGLEPAQVAAEVGFADQSHLGRHFKRLVGLSPGCYRSTRTRAR